MINEINYIDFKPQVINKSFWGSKTYEDHSVIMERLNEWVRKNYNREIINIETLILPITANGSQTTNATKLNMHSGIVHMIQTIRVWYK